MHISVLAKELLEAFATCHLTYFLDGTVGAGGHSRMLLEAHPEMKKLIAVDQDENALKEARNNLKSWGNKIEFLHSNFASIPFSEQFSGILVDLGVSSMQLDQGERGFSFMREGPLDMRMDRTQSLTAEEIVNTWSEEDLGQIFREFGEEPRWRVAARSVVAKRKEKRIESTMELVETLRPYFAWKKKGINPLTLIFQALRIAVNDELAVIASFIPKAIEHLAPGGRLAVITFHSLEDRIVKNLFRDAASDKQNTIGLQGIFLPKTPTVKLITKRAVQPSEEEKINNPRSRSAKLRVVERL